MLRLICGLAALGASLLFVVPASAEPARTLSGALVSVSPTHVRVKGEHAAIRCAVGARSPSVAGFAQGDRVQVACVLRRAGGFVLTRIRLCTRRPGRTLPPAPSRRSSSPARSPHSRRPRSACTTAPATSPARSSPPHRSRRREARRSRQGHLHRWHPHLVCADRQDRADTARRALTPGPRAGSDPGCRRLRLDHRAGRHVADDSQRGARRPDLHARRALAAPRRLPRRGSREARLHRRPRCWSRSRATRAGCCRACAAACARAW